jgi:hypothetical protein
VRQNGLCDRETCRRHILPQLAKPIGLLKLMGDALVEQKSRQTTRELPVSDEQESYLVRRALSRSRKRARTGRGYFALAKAIMNRHVQDGGHTPAGLSAAPVAQHAEQGHSTQPGVSQ